MSPEAERLFILLRDGVPHRELYRGRDGNWYVTYGGGGPFSFDAVSEVKRSPLVRDVYSSLPGQCFHIGKTLDCDATMKERQNHRRRKDAPLIFTDGSRELRR